MMKTYKDFEKKYIGSSDIASLVLVGCGDNGVESQLLHFGHDDGYDAYIVDGDAEIGAHYELSASFSDWAKVYDDEGLCCSFVGAKINFFRAGEMGCIIQVIEH